jgi:hypothetical protein
MLSSIKFKNPTLMEDHWYLEEMNISQIIKILQPQIKTWPEVRLKT